MKHGYRFAIQWVADEDNPVDLGESEIAGYVTTALVADLFGKTVEDVARDISKIRNKQEAE